MVGVVFRGWQEVNSNVGVGQQVNCEDGIGWRVAAWVFVDGTAGRKDGVGISLLGDFMMRIRVLGLEADQSLAWLLQHDRIEIEYLLARDLLLCFATFTPHCARELAY